MAEERKMMAYTVNKKKPPEEREYLVCIAGIDSEDEWYLITGRTEVYDLIKNAIEYIDLEESFVLVETAKLSERKSIYDFMKYAGEFYNDGFDIEDYVKGDYYVPEDDVEPQNSSNYDERINMEDFMNNAMNIVDTEGDE